MTRKTDYYDSEFFAHFKVFHELMSNKVEQILLVSSAYDAFILDEEGSLPSRIINEYRGLNLSRPPIITRTSSSVQALDMVSQKAFDIVITMPHLDETDAFSLGLKIKKIKPGLPVILLSHTTRGIYPFPEGKDLSGIDKVFIWNGNADLLLALVKNVEDRLNVEKDTARAMVRVLILVEDSPMYRSTFLPLIYKEVVKQTQAVLGEGLNEEHRLLKMRARPKILVAENYEEAVDLYHRYGSYLFGVISDTRFPRAGRLDDNAGYILLDQIRKKVQDVPLLLLSSDPENKAKADKIPALFLDKNSPDLLLEIRNFFISHLGFGDFVFRMPKGQQIGRASSLRELEEKVALIPDECLLYHAERNHFSNWIMGRSEIILASKFRQVKASEFSTIARMREYIISNVHKLRKWRQKGVVAQFRRETFDADIMDFVKVGQGLLGGKARGLAFMAGLLRDNPNLFEKFPHVNIKIPKTLVITTEGFEAFVTENDLKGFSADNFSDTQVAESFLKSKIPESLRTDLRAFLKQVKYPLSVRSSSLLEDAQFQPYAGLYETYMIPNNHPDIDVRLEQLLRAIKLVYASTYYESPKAFSRSTANSPQEESMAVIIQQLAGSRHGDYFYPSISGVALSHNYYPISRMKPNEGIAHIALGLGKTVVEGEKALRFCPRHPTLIPQFSVIEDILENAQRSFYALNVNNYPEDLIFSRDSNLEKRAIDDAESEMPIKLLSSTYIPEEHRIRDTGYMNGPKVLTFAQILKHDIFPLPELLTDFLALGRKGMGWPVEIEFSIELSAKKSIKSQFYFLQMRPMVGDARQRDVCITEEDMKMAFCISYQALGNGENHSIQDIVYVKPEDFRPESTLQMAEEIGRINALLVKEKRPYMLVGFGRWGSADRWLGIPVQWRHISGVGAIIEIRNEKLRADPSQGSHFFQNITSLGIHYITVTEGTKDRFDWRRLKGLPVMQESEFVRHVRLKNNLVLKIDGKTSQCVILGL